MQSVGASSWAISRRPLRIVSRATPVADETTASPPQPIASDSAAAHRRRLRFVQQGLDPRILRNKGRFQLDVSLHTSSTDQKPGR